MKNCQKTLILGFVVLSLTACSYDSRQHAVKQHIDNIKAQPAAPVDTIPVFKPLAQFSYAENQAKRSPFKAPQTKTGSQVLQPDMARPKQPLENYPMDALKFVGTLEEGMRRWALIRTPEGQVIRVHLGDYMGQNYGKIIAVSENSLIIEERVLEEGTWVKHTMTFKLEDTMLPKGPKKK